MFKLLEFFLGCRRLDNLFHLIMWPVYNSVLWTAFLFEIAEVEGAELYTQGYQKLCYAVVLERSCGCILVSAQFDSATTAQYVQQYVAELLADQTVDDEVDGRVERQKSVGDCIATAQDVDLRLPTVGRKFHHGNGTAQSEVRQLTDDKHTDDHDQ